MSINPLAAKIPFGVASPPYQSRSAGSDFEDILLQIQEELKAAEMYYTSNLLSPDSLSSKTRRPSAEEAELLAVSQLFNMDATEFSLLDDLLMMALEDTRLLKQASTASEDEKNANPALQAGERYRMDLSKISGLLRKPL